MRRAMRDSAPPPTGSRPTPRRTGTSRPPPRSASSRQTGSSPPDAGLWRPFSGAARKPTRRELVRLLRRIYGADSPEYLGSPYEGDPLDAAEIILRELAHLTQIPSELPLEVGNLEPTWDRIHDHIRQLGVADADGHEIRAIAIELGVA